MINKGVGGINTSRILSELEENLNKYNPDMVTTMMGINDHKAIIVYEDIPTKKTTLFFKSFRTYKLAKLLQRHIINKTRELGICKPKENIATWKDSSTPSSIYNHQVRPTEGPKETALDNYQAYIKLGRQYMKNADFTKAEEMFKKAIEIDPKDNWAYIGLGKCYKRQDKYDKAEEMLKKAIEIDPESYEAYIELGWCHRGQDKYEKSEEMFKKALEIDPKITWIYDELVWCYKNQRNYDEAEEILKKAIEINPKNDRICGILAQLYEEQGENRSAEEYFRKANRLRLGYYNPITQYNYQRLKEIVAKRGIKLVCVQYPARSVEPFKKMFKDKEGIIFVDNEKIFKEAEALKQVNYNEYFKDMFGGDFGHCTRKGNRLLAENIANVILKECFNK